MDVPTSLHIARQFIRSHWLLLALLVFCFIGPWLIFIEIAKDIWESGGFRGDRTILIVIHRFSTPWLDRLALFLAAIGGPHAILLDCAIITTYSVLRSRFRDALFFALSIGGAVLLNLAAKTAFSRPRPSIWESIQPGTSFSFPSGHAMASTALAVALAFMLWESRWRWLVWITAALFALGVGLSRMYLGVHYPSDVMAGWVGSLGWVGGLYLLFSPTFRHYRHGVRDLVRAWREKTATRPG